MNPTRLAHETPPLTPPINSHIRSTPPAGGRGSYRLKIEKTGCGARRGLRSKFVQHSG